MITPYIHEKQNELVTEVERRIKIFAKIHWEDKTIVTVYTTQANLLRNVLYLQTNYTNYYKTQYNAVKITILERINKNPHIPLV